MTQPKPAATVVVARQTDDDLEVLLLQRTHSAVFMPGVYVFPGGALDAGDRDPALEARTPGTDDQRASHLLGVSSGGLAYLVGAIRECFEEAGLLLAEAADGRDPSAVLYGDLPRLRHALAGGTLSMAELCERYELQLVAERMGYLAHWVTPPGRPRRYDTRFFVIEAPPGQQASHDGQETVAHAWVAPAEALVRNARGEFPLAPPTIRTLNTLAQFRSTAELLNHGRRHVQSPDPVPRAAFGRDGPRCIHPSEPAYAEIARVQALGLGEGSYEILPGIVTQLAPKVRRLTAPNPGVMTGPGTNTYLVGDAEAMAVIDPGPNLDSHIDAIREAAGGPIRWILTTHTHRDHSPASRKLQAATGAEVLGMPPPAGGTQDQSFIPDRVPVHGERLKVAPGTTLRTLHTPGHASNHMCYLLEEEQLLFSGDHIMQGSTVVINPPDGHMGAYLESLEALRREPIEHIAPGHGFLLAQPEVVIDRIVSHRLAREGKVMAAMRRIGAADLDTLLPEVYDDVPTGMYTVAARSLLAHLIKLQEDGAARLHGNTWYPDA